MERTDNRLWQMVAIGTIAALAGCGGGGGAAAESATANGPSESPAGGAVAAPAPAPAPAPAAAIEPIVEGNDSFDFKVSGALKAPGALDHLAGGQQLFAAWNPRNPLTALKPGMKVQFFGHAEGCSKEMDEGPVTTGLDADYAQATSRTSIASAAAEGRRWVPSASTASCAGSLQGRDGPSMVHLNADGSSGGVGLYTTSGPQSDGQPGFLTPYTASGQNGLGANAGITGTFVGFRQAWWAADPVQPWLAGDGRSAGTARMLSVQSVGTAQPGEQLPASSNVQTKQQVSVDFINVECAKLSPTAARPCQLEYLFNTAIHRAGVSDWSSVAWFQKGSIWFDPAQGGTPIVEGPLKAAGDATTDGDSGLALFVSKGSPTLHTTFRNQTFDVRIGFEQLQNALRIVVGRKLGVAATAVQDSDLAAMWGARWNDPAAWALLNSNVGQEVHNPFADKSAYIGGAFKQLYVGPQP